MGKKRSRFISLMVVIMIDICLFFAVIFLMDHVQKLLQNDVRINLTEIVTQNKDVITSKISLELNNLELAADQIADRYDQAAVKDEDALKRIFQKYAAEKRDSRLSVAQNDGIAVFSDGEELNIAGRKYFRLAMQGKPNISERVVSRRDGQDIFMISVPLKYRGKVVAALQKEYTPEQMYDICSVSLFSEQGSLYIINSDGYILINSEQKEYLNESDNYFRMLYLDSPEDSRRLYEDIQNGRAGFMETSLGGKAIFSAYTPLDKAYDWFLISSVDPLAVSPNANTVIRMFYFVLLMIVVFFAYSLFYYIGLKRKQQANMERIAFVDSVTGGNSYAKFLFDLQRFLKASPEKPLFLFTFDIDNFKYINSVYGFDVGDRILREVQSLYANKLTGSELIARVYSDHFVMLLEDASEKRLSSLFDSEFSLEDITVYLSAGLYPISNPDESVNLMLDKARLAASTVKGLNHNKKVGIYSESFDREMQRNEEIKRAMELALVKGEIIAYYQPKVHIDTGELVGAEALARWLTGDGRMIPPGDFIPVCEKTGLIEAVDMAIFESALRFLRRSLDAGVPCVPISVNFSRMHLFNSDFLPMLAEKLRSYNVPPSLIQLELTETVLFDNYQKMSDFIDRVHETGLQIAMDDFGSGYSSLHMLKDMDIDMLKIDQGFLKETVEGYRQEAIFAAITQMAEKLNISVVVEGVETVENINLMRKYGCEIAQGFYFARPMAESDFEKLYQEGQLW